MFNYSKLFSTTAKIRAKKVTVNNPLSKLTNYCMDRQSYAPVVDQIDET